MLFLQIIGSLVAILTFYTSLRDFYKQGKSITNIVLSLLSLVLLVAVALSVREAETHSKVEEQELLNRIKERIQQDVPDVIYQPNQITETETFTKQSALQTLSTILTELKGKEDKLTIQERFQYIQEDDEWQQYISDSILARVYAPKELQTDSFYQNSALALLTIRQAIGQVEHIQPITNNLTALVLDEQTKTVSVPLEVFTGRYTGFTVRMVFIDSNWKIDTHSLLNNISLIDYLTSRKVEE